VVHGWPRLMLATAYDCHGVHNNGATCLLVDVIVVIGRGCSLLAVLLAPLLATLGALLGILDDDVGRRFPVAAWGWVKLGHLIADGVLGGDAV
jgi:hypothetical protein